MLDCSGGHCRVCILESKARCCKCGKRLSPPNGLLPPWWWCSSVQKRRIYRPQLIASQHHIRVGIAATDDITQVPTTEPRCLDHFRNRHYPSWP